MSIEVGRLCLKLAGRDAGKKAVIVDILENNYVLIDGEVRRRKCNILHLEPLKEVIKIKKGASRNDVKAEFKKLGIELRDTKPKEKKERPKKLPKKKEEVEKKAKKETKKKEEVKKADKPKKEVKPKAAAEKKPEVKKEKAEKKK